MMTIAELWRSTDERDWLSALDQYWRFVQPKNVDLERAMETLDLERLRRMNASEWYGFLRDEYFRWKYTVPFFYVAQTKWLRRHEKELGSLHDIKERLLAVNQTDTRLALSTAREIHGLGAAGASGLLALMYPTAFGTVDQFVVKALREVGDLVEGPQLARMNPKDLSVEDGVLLIGIMSRKAAQNNLTFNTTEWTPRKIDKILWTYGR